MFNNEVMRTYGIKWRRINDSVVGMMAFHKGADSALEIEQDCYFYFYLNQEKTEFYMGFATKRMYDQGVYNVFQGPGMNEIVIRNPKLSGLLSQPSFYRTLYSKYMGIYSSFYKGYREGDIYAGIISVEGRHYHYLSSEKLAGGYDYYIEEIKQPCKPYMPLADSRIQIQRFSFTNQFMASLSA